MIILLSNLKKAQKIGIAILVPTLLIALFYYNDDYSVIYGSLTGAGAGLLLWSKDPKENKK
ncbi:hypothetical protein [Gillisia sp. JM1]|uniref:hypothetical protein n=1 Tax=Gillisia sp. JM1 TaxID=1283286 RepID=UPI0003FA28B1|nr:hypothetical protein [Gillisia sp. JM1]